MVATTLLDPQLVNELPKQKFWEVVDLYKWEGFWFRPDEIQRIQTMQSHFQAQDDDVILASSMKTGTTWLKALCYCIMARQVNNDKELVNHVPHAYVPTLETNIYRDNSLPDLSCNSLKPSPRLIHTHLPFNVLPDSIKNTNCKIVYITRNPKDTLVSIWHFFNKILRQKQDPLEFEDAFESFCNGIHSYGPFFDHNLTYWNESKKNPEKVLFLKYEDLIEDPKEEVKNLASFLGKPFQNGDDDAVEKVIWECSLDRLKNLEVMKKGAGSWQLVQNSSGSKVPFSTFFRLGTVGDWKNYFTPKMSARLDEISRSKLQGSGLDLHD